MNKAVTAMILVTLVARLLAAQSIDLKPLIGTDWYGLYFNGQKAGYAMSDLTVDAQGNAVFSEEAHFRIVMATIKQDMSTTSKRIYAPDGDLIYVESVVVDPSGITTRLEAKVQGEVMLQRSEVGGSVTEKQFPKPPESIDDALRQLELIKPGAKVGDKVTYSLYEPLNQTSVTGVSTVKAIEERVLDGVTTKVLQIETILNPLGLTTMSFVTENGDLLEDVLAGILVMRLEPKDMAMDVNYSNDVVVSNAAMLDMPIENPRDRDTLTLTLKGPVAPEHVFNDERQQVTLDGGVARFTAKRIEASSLNPPPLPVTDESVKEWTQPSLFIQSDNPKLVEKAEAILGSETNSLKAVELLCHWVYDNVRSTFSARLSNALEVLEHLEGDCTEHSILFIGLARAAGIPAREVAGLIYVDKPQPGFFYHQWAKVWLGEWVDVDPTFNQPFADVTHVKLVEGDLVTQARILPLIGQLDVDVVDAAPSAAK